MSYRDRPSSPANALGLSHHPTPSASAPLTRSRTLLFLSVRSTCSHPSAGRRPQFMDYDDNGGDDDDDEEAGLMGGGPSKGKGKARATMSSRRSREAGGREGSFAIDMPLAGLPPAWVDTSDAVNALLAQVTTKVAALDKLHAKHVLPGFKDRSAEEREIEALTASITRDFRSAQTQIKRIHTKPGNDSRAELVSATNVQRGLAQKVQDMSAGFRRKQRVYMQKLQGHAIKNQDALIASGAITLGSSGGQDALEEDLQMSQSQLQANHSSLDATIRQRDAELTSIARSIGELAQLFQDLGDMIVEQGTMLDSVEYNLEVVAREMTGAVEELETATKYQKNTGRRKCIFLLVLLIFGLVIVLIYKPRSRGPTISPTPPAFSAQSAPPQSSGPPAPVTVPAMGVRESFASPTPLGSARMIVGGGTKRRRKRPEWPM